MDNAVASSSHDLAQRLFDKNIELENRRRKSAQARVPSDPNTWQQMRENFETIILEDHTFSEKHNIEFALWQLHYRRIEEFRAHYNAASATDSTNSQTRAGSAPARPDRALKIRLQFKTFLSEATGYYHDLILKIRAKYGLPIGQFYPEPENHNVKEKNGKKFNEIKKGLVSCHRCLIYLGDLARYKGLYGEGESKSRDYAAASSYYLQAASIWPSSGNPHHQLAILATYSGDELMAVYRYFRSLAAENPFSTARDNLIVAFEKNRQSFTQLHVDSKAPSLKESSVRTRGKGRGKVDPIIRSKEPITDTTPDIERANETRQTFKAFRVRFVRLNGILFTRTSLETFEEILSQVTNNFQNLLSSGPEDAPNFGIDNTENALFIVILVSILIFTVNNVKGGPEGQTYADIVQNTVLLKNALATFYDLTTQLLKRCLQMTDLPSSFLLPGVLICMEWIACRPDVIPCETDEKSTCFWTHCVSLFNKLLAADVARCEEGDDDDYVPPALWEDFEVRGFLPLQPAQTILDFSRKCSVFSGDSKKDKAARVKRIVAAGKVVADRITIDRKKVKFDQNLKKFVIGVETPKQNSNLVAENKSNGVVKEVEPRVEFEDEDEVIVFRPTVPENPAFRSTVPENPAFRPTVPENPAFRPTVPENPAFQPTVIDNRPENPALQPNMIDNRPEIPKESQRDGFDFDHGQNKDMGNSQFSVPVSMYNLVGQPYQSPMWPGSFTGGIKGLSLMENGQVGQPGMQSLDNLNAGFVGVRESSGVNYVTAPPSNSFSNMKVSTGRPVRHLGPPPGFSSVRPNKQTGQNHVNDDYSWLDGYQLQSSMKPINLPSNLNTTQYLNDSVATSSFPFPGKQVPAVQNWPETASDHHQLQQGQQSTWKGNQFV